mmetsp:Transcript_3153/g.4617  ORF Transcript_3153/g.4617 Transcript_3153/m.4617 type:complete len:88 (+) Transcript_3153:94-357(+)
MVRQIQLRSQRDLEQVKGILKEDTNWRINKRLLDNMRDVCFTRCVTSINNNGLTSQQESCLSSCIEMYRMAEYIVRQSSNAKKPFTF